jgi:hypothetical protein
MNIISVTCAHVGPKVSICYITKISFPKSFFVKLIQFSMTKKYSKFNILHIIVYRSKNFTFIKSFYFVRALQQYKEHAQILLWFFLVWM